MTQKLQTLIIETKFETTRHVVFLTLMCFGYKVHTVEILVVIFIVLNLGVCNRSKYHFLI